MRVRSSACVNLKKLRILRSSFETPMASFTILNIEPLGLKMPRLVMTVVTTCLPVSWQLAPFH